MLWLPRTARRGMAGATLVEDEKEPSPRGYPRAAHQVRRGGPRRLGAQPHGGLLAEAAAAVEGALRPELGQDVALARHRGLALVDRGPRRVQPQEPQRREDGAVPEVVACGSP